VWAGDVADEALARGRGGEVPADQVRRRRGGHVLLGQRPAAPPRDTDDVTFTHDALDPLAVDPPPAPAQFVGHPRRAVGTTVLPVNTADLPGQLVFGLSPRLSGRLGGEPLVVALST